MKKLLSAAVAAAFVIPSVAAAQETTSDGSRAFGIDPYVGVLGGYEGFESAPGGGIPVSQPGNRLKGGLVEGVVGVNVPLNSFFVGVEGNAAKGFTGDIDWEYGVHGRVGARAGETGLIYVKAGYRWVNFDRYGNDSRDYGRISYGIGVERTIPIHSPKIDHIEKVRSGKVRRAKLFYLRDRVGKAAKIKER